MSRPRRVPGTRTEPGNGCKTRTRPGATLNLAGFRVLTSNQHRPMVCLLNRVNSSNSLEVRAVLRCDKLNQSRSLYFSRFLLSICSLMSLIFYQPRIKGWGYTSACLSACMPACLPVCPHACPSACLFTCLPGYLR